MLLVMVMMSSMVVAVGGWVVLGPASAARGRAGGGGGRAHVGAGLHLLLLPSRQMPAVVHHAGLGCAVEWLMR